MKGKLAITTGPMFAGKTTALLQEVSKFSPDQIRIFKPKIDVRYSKQSVASHAGRRAKAILLDQVNPDLLSYITDSIRTIFIDELNFFDFSSLSPQIQTALSKNIDIFGYGLSYDFAKKPFGSTLQLAQMADSVHTLEAICDGCGKDAIHSYRKKKIDEYLVVGGAELYGACCENCYERIAKL